MLPYSNSRFMSEPSALCSLPFYFLMAIIWFYPDCQVLCNRLSSCLWVLHNPSALKLDSLFFPFLFLMGTKGLLPSLPVSTMDSYSLLGHYVIPHTLYLMLYDGCLMPIRRVMMLVFKFIEHDLSLHISLPCQWRAHLLCSFRRYVCPGT
jgi:hypothetical protein